MAIVISNPKYIKRQEIKNEKGEVLREIVYNPNDIATLDKFWGIYDKINTGSQKQAEIEAELESMDADILDRDLETVAEFQTAGAVIIKKGETLKAAIVTFDDIVAGLDDIFGDGVCQLFTNGYKDITLLDTLINGVLPDFEAAANERKKYVEQYKRNREQRRASEKA